MKKRKIILIDGLSTSGKSTTSYNLAKKLPGWLFIDIWRIKDIFEPLGYSTDLDKKEANELMEISKEATIKLAREVIRKTQRNIIIQEATEEYVKKKLGKDLRKYNYRVYVVQCIIPLDEAIKRDKKRKKPTLGISNYWTEEKWTNKLKRKNKNADVVINTLEKKPREVIKIILKAIGEKPKIHPYENKIRKFW